MKINVVGKTRKIVIPSGKWVIATESDDIEDAEGIILTSATPYAVFGLLSSDTKFVPESSSPSSIRLGKGEPTIFIEIGKKVELWLRHDSNMPEVVFIQEYK